MVSGSESSLLFSSWRDLRVVRAIPREHQHPFEFPDFETYRSYLASLQVSLAVLPIDPASFRSGMLFGLLPRLETLMDGQEDDAKYGLKDFVAQGLEECLTYIMKKIKSHIQAWISVLLKVVSGLDSSLLCPRFLQCAETYDRQQVFRCSSSQVKSIRHSLEVFETYVKRLKPIDAILLRNQVGIKEMLVDVTTSLGVPVD